MGYFAEFSEVRVIAGGKVYKPLEVSKVYCDPCALPAKRYRITQDNGYQQTLAYWELITEWDNARDRYIKWAINREVSRINTVANEAERAARQANMYGHTPNLKLA